MLSLHYNGNLFVNGVEQLKFTTNVNEIKKVPLCLGNISSDWSITYATDTEFYGNVFDFAVDYVPINGVKIIYSIPRYLIKKMTLYKMFSLIKKVRHYF